MQKVGKPKILKGKCPNCENKFIATADNFMIRCPYCHTYLRKTTGFFCETIWEEPSWGFKIVKEVNRNDYN